MNKVPIIIREFIFLLMLFSPYSFTFAQTGTPANDSAALALLERLSPEEKIGQLFMITFSGTDVGPDSDVYKLITQYHVGNIVLQAKNDNITHVIQSPNDTARQIRNLTMELQQNEWSASFENKIDPETNESVSNEYIPLFVGISQEGDGYPFDQILYGITTIPNQMAMGATWNPELTAEIGKIQGSELSRLGINLIIGPSLDILESPHVNGGSEFGTRSFGGDPYWVGELGRHYIRGIHIGSNGRIAVAAKYFPGHGASDRLPEEEVATVRKSLEELINFDLAPFFSVTGNAISDEDIVDALLTSHIRYQGLQGNIRSTTRPVSLDPEAFDLLMELPPLLNWRQGGGVMISDDLGSSAIRRFYNLTSQSFDIRRVALNAFLAGNDLLYISDFSTEEGTDSFSEIVDTLEFFTQKYQEDNAFAQRVDESVLRMINLKFSLYDEFTINQVLSNPTAQSNEQEVDQTIFEVARQAATLISPTLQELDDTIPDPPNLNDRIVFITDTRTAQQCSECSQQPLLDRRALQEFVTRRYGPQAGGQIAPNNLTSYSLTDLEQLLDQTNEDSILERDLLRSNWLVFVMLDANDQLPSYRTLARFLNERPDLIQQNRLILFAFNAPYYLDATNISKLSAYYGLYSKTPQFVDLASYLLFREIRPTGASPVSIAGINYDLNKQLFPDPEQIIPIVIDIETTQGSEFQSTPEPPPIPEYNIGDFIPIRTGLILDHNGNPVPDGTVVNFILTFSGETSSTRQTEYTTDGIARTTFPVTNSGTLEIYAESEPAISEVLKIDVQLPLGGFLPTEATNQTTVSISPSVEIPTPSPIVQMIPPVQPPPIHPSLTDWIMALLLSSIVAWSSYRLSSLIGQPRWGVRAGFLTLICGLLAYSYLAFHLPGSEDFMENSVSRSVFIFTSIGVIAGLVITIAWRAMSERQKSIEQPKESG